jgi:uncharacterized Rossmann fold enzyme
MMELGSISGDAYVLGSGATLAHIEPRFFAGKFVISTNHGCTMLGIKPDVFVTKYHHHAREYATTFPGIPIVVTLHNEGDRTQRVIEDGPWIALAHPHNQTEHWDGSLPPEGQVLATYSSITTAMHVAAIMGAANIILAGHDGGFIDGEGRVPGYRADNADSVWWGHFDRQTAMAKRILIERYGVTVTSINPWVSLRLEGHHYEPA